MKLQKSLTIIILFILCSSLSAQKSKGRATTTDMQSGKVIDFTNTVIDLNNQQSSKWTYYQSFVDAARGQAEKIIKNGNHSVAITLTYNEPSVTTGYILKYETAANKKTAFPEKENIILAVKKAREDVKILDEWTTKLNSYFVNKLFIEDESLLGYAELSDSVESKLDISRKSWRNAVTLAADAGEDAEIVALSNKKITVYIDPIKTNIRTFRNLMYEFYDLNKTSKADYSQLSKKVDAYKKVLDDSNAGSSQNKNIYVSANDTRYPEFYDTMTECSEYLSNLLSELMSDDPDNSTIEYNNRLMTENYSQLVKLYKDYIAEFSKK